MMNDPLQVPTRKSDSCIDQVQKTHASKCMVEGVVKQGVHLLSPNCGGLELRLHLKKDLPLPPIAKLPSRHEEIHPIKSGFCKPGFLHDTVSSQWSM